MAKNVSTKKPLFGNKRSHACNATKMRQKVNMQKVTLNGVTVIMSAKEAKKFKNSTVK